MEVNKKTEKNQKEELISRLNICKEKGYTERRTWEKLLESEYADDILMYQLINFLWDYFDPEEWLCNIKDVDEAYRERDVAIGDFLDCFEHPFYLSEFLDDAKIYLETVYYLDSDKTPSFDSIKERIPWIIENIDFILK